MKEIKNVIVAKVGSGKVINLKSGFRIEYSETSRIQVGISSEEFNENDIVILNDTEYYFDENDANEILQAIGGIGKITISNGWYDQVIAASEKYKKTHEIFKLVTKHSIEYYKHLKLEKENLLFKINRQGRLGLVTISYKGFEVARFSEDNEIHVSKVFSKLKSKDLSVYVQLLKVSAYEFYTQTGHKIGVFGNSICKFGNNPIRIEVNSDLIHENFYINIDQGRQKLKAASFDEAKELIINLLVNWVNKFSFELEKAQ